MGFIRAADSLLCTAVGVTGEAGALLGAVVGVADEAGAMEEAEGHSASSEGEGARLLAAERLAGRPARGGGGRYVHR